MRDGSPWFRPGIAMALPFVVFAAELAFCEFYCLPKPLYDVLVLAAPVIGLAGAIGTPLRAMWRVLVVPVYAVAMLAWMFICLAQAGCICYGECL